MDRLRRIRAAAAAVVLAVFCPCAWALNPSLDISQYAHTSWTIRDGFFDSAIQTIAQTPDGYLWLGTEFGLFRFDGVQKVLWNPPPSEQLPSPNVAKLLAARDGRLWIGTRAGLVSWKDNRLVRYTELPVQPIVALAEDGEGTLWVGTWTSPAGRLCAIRGGGMQCYGQDGSLGPGALSLFVENGNLWVSAGSGLWRWNPSPPKHYASPELATDFSTAEDGRLVIATGHLLKQLVAERTESSPIAAGGRPYGAYRLLRDRDGGLWIGTIDRGLLHVHQGRTDQFSQTGGLSGDTILALFEDREGNIWVATSGGIDRFRDFSVPTMSSKQGLAGDLVSAVLASNDGSVWITGTGGISRWKNGQITNYGTREGLPAGTESLLEDSGGRIWVSTQRGLGRWEGGRFVLVRSGATSRTWQIAEAPAGNFWTAWDAGLIHLLGDEVVERIPWPALGHSDVASFLAGDAKRGGLWLGFREGGLLFFKDGQVRESYASSGGLGAGMVVGVSPRPDGSVWAATKGGFSRIKDGHVATLNTRNGLPCDSVRAAIEDAGHAVWLYLDCGLARISSNEFEAWSAHPDHLVNSTVFGASDGVIKQTSVDQNPKAARLKDGQLWFATNRGVSMVDPQHLPENKLLPPVHIEEIVADDQAVWQNVTSVSSANPRLPALTHRLEIRYTALSLAAPEKVHFKYMLEGYDRGWMEAVNKRDVTYTNLPPRNYRFRVMASNNSGVWNETGDTLEFSIAPAYYQTNWFRALVAAALLAMMGAVYQLRVWQVQQESRRLRDVIETIPAYVWSALPDGFVDFVNRRWLEFSGFSLDQAKGWGWADALHPEDRGRLLEAFRGAIASGKPLEQEGRMRGADGQYRWLLFRSVPQRDGSGKIVKWYGKSMDIDDRKRAEETLRETETRFRTYIDHATDAFFVLDFEGGTILDVNHRACKNLGYTREELVGKSVFEFEAGLDPEWLERNIRPRIEAGESVTFETQHRRKDGSVFPVEIRARAFQTGGRMVNLSLVQDITERKRAEEERERLRQMEIDLAHINRVSMMGELAASVAHEVNQPLAGIVSNGSAGLRFLTGDAPDVEEAVEALRDIVRDGKRAGEIIKRIRALTKRAETPRETLDLNETILDVLALVGDEAKKNSVTVRTQLADEVSPVHGDRVQLQQVLLNLIMNAIQAMSGISDRERRLVITTQNVDGGRVQVTVEDSGTGLDPDKIAKIFEPFYTTKSGGMGMGLSICRSILQNHGGRLWATANEGPGASFHFTLPKHQGEESSAEAAAD